jgi:hypothetical protein
VAKLFALRIYLLKHKRVVNVTTRFIAKKLFGLLFFFHLHNFASFEVTAVITNGVGQAFVSAVRTSDEVGQNQSIL